MRNQLKALAILLIFILPVITLAGDERTVNWYDSLELPSSPQIDVKWVGIQLKDSDLMITVEMHSDSVPKPDYYTGRIYLDVKQGGETSGEIKGSDYQIAFYLNPSNGSDRGCFVYSYNDVKMQWEESKTLSCSVQLSGGKLVIVGKEFGRAMDLSSFKLKSYFDFLRKDVYKKSYSLSNSGRAKVDGDYGEYKIPLISGAQAATFPPIQYKEVYVIDDLSRLYVAIVPSSGEGTGCNVRGTGSRLTRNYFISIDLDGNESNGVDLSAKYSYVCTPEGRMWYPDAAYAGSGDIAVGKAVEFSVKLLSSLAKISSYGGNFDLTLKVSLVYRDTVPDSGWIQYGTNLPSPESFEVIARSADLEMNKDLAERFKSFGSSASGFFRIELGGPAVDPSYSSDPSVKFLRGKDGLFRGVELSGRDYWASYGSIDYAVIRVLRVGEGYYCSVAGVTRYGTRAGLIWISNNIQALSPGSIYLVKWVDDGDRAVELDEVSLVAVVP